jgi:hypothetical protein
MNHIMVMKYMTKLMVKCTENNLDIAVDIATSYGMDNSGFEIRVHEDPSIFPSQSRLHCFWGPPSPPSMG